MLNKDYLDILQSLLSHKVKFMVVGAYAMGTYGYPRATGDIDIWVEASTINARKIYQALAEFGAPLTDLDEKTFTEPGIIFQIGIAPRRIDILTRIDGVTFKNAYRTKETLSIQGISIPFISKADLITNKQATGRRKDQVDADFLKEQCQKK